MRRLTNQHGLTLIEVLVYALLLAVLSVALVLFAVRVVQHTSTARVTSSMLDNAQGAMAVMTREIRQASGVYTPTSAFDSHPGQLSLATTQHLPADEEETYVDFYLDDERLYRKREGEAVELITAENVRITNLAFAHLNQSSPAPAIQIMMTVVLDDSAAATMQQSTISLVTTTALRAY